MKIDKKCLREADAWNEKYPVGTPVSVQKDDGSILLTKTRSFAWVVGGHSVLVSVESIAGGYLLGRCTPINKTG